MYLMTYRREENKYIVLSQMPICIHEDPEFLRANWKMIVSIMPGEIKNESEWTRQGDLSVLEFDHIIFNDPSRMQISIYPVGRAEVVMEKAVANA